ncbi:hypothetical protein Dda_5105 [Drechslerella dactyloides]|uniref:Uncharacterized protein n=1 Tax=Drechslerella dactyloides TaxID=74499 RepID=A0AAD6IVN4_DREDA|nr:hypothetical protein Dda_5105 [Drechslerella dactyloides]
MKPPLPRLRGLLPRRRHHPTTLPHDLTRRRHAHAIHNDHGPPSQRADHPRPNHQRKHDRGPPSRYQDLAVNSHQTHYPKYINRNVNAVFHLDPTRIGKSATTVFRCPHFYIQYSSAILLLSAYSILVNPFHPLLRASLKRHAETYDLGFFFHLHTSSKAFTGREAFVRKAIRGKVRSAWETALTNRGYDAHTGRFVRHLQADWDATRQVRQQDLRGTVSVNPNESCRTARFSELVAQFEKGFDAVMGCGRKDPGMEVMMQPEKLYKFYDNRRSLLLRKYTSMGYGLSINGEEATGFKAAVGNRGGERGDEQLVQVDGETYDVGPLKMSDQRKKVGLVTPGEELKTFHGGRGGGGGDAGAGGLSSRDLDWGLDDMDVFSSGKATSEKSQRTGKKHAKPGKNPRATWSPPADDGF